MNDKPRLLIVEDEAVIGLDLAQHLRDFGYDVVGIAASSERARELADEHRPDLILMDIVIKGSHDGVETARLICAEIDVPVVFLTAYSDQQTLERVAQVAPYGYLVKPFRPADLRTTIEVARQRHLMARQIMESERWLSSTLQCLGDGIIATDVNGRVRFMNPAAEQLAGRVQSEVRNVPVQEFFALLDADASKRQPDPTAKALASGQPTRLETGTLRRRPGADPIPVEVRASPIRDNQQRLLGAVLVVRDISERRRTEAALARLAHLDTLTGLPNRAALMPQLDAMASNARRLGNLLAVLFLDLDGFKRVNDSFGHRIGDQLLVQLARRLRETLRVEDFVARLGGDEFIVLAGNLGQASMSRSIAQKLIDSLGQPYGLDGQQISVTVSIGVSLCPLEPGEPAGLLRNADTAMYWAKGRGKNQFALFLDGPDRHAPERARETSFSGLS